MHEFYVNDQHPMYVQRWDGPQRDADRAAIFVHGGAHTGMCWTSCPDGRPGWVRHLTESGWTAFVVDWPGVGRSPRRDDFLSSGPAPIVHALVELLHVTGPALLIGHSIGAALSVKVIEQVPGLVTGFLAVNPAPPAIAAKERVKSPEDQPVRFDEPRARTVFANARRFPIDAFDAYFRSLCDMSPSVFNAIGSTTYSDALEADPIVVRKTRSLVIAGDEDRLAPEVSSQGMADYLGCKHIMVGRDWSLDGYGHMIPVEMDSQIILDKALEELYLPGCHTNDME